MKFLNGAYIGKTHAKGRQNPRERVDKDALHPQHIGDQTRMLSPGAAKAIHRVLRDVIPALYADFLDGVRHVFNRDAQETFGDLFNRFVRPDLLCKFFELVAHDVGIQRLVCVWPEDGGKLAGLQFAQQHIAVGYSERTATPVGRRTWVCACTFRPNLHAPVAETQDRTTARRNGVDRHHGRTHTHACNFGFKAAFEIACKVADIGGGAAHVKANQLFKAKRFGGSDHPNDAAGRPRQDRVFALEQTRVSQPAVRLHEHQVVAPTFGCVQRRRDLINIAPQDGGEICVDNRRVAA